MRSPFLIIALALSLLDIANSAPLPLVRLDQRGLHTRSADTTSDGANTLILTPINPLTADDSSAHLFRRAPGFGKGLSRKKSHEEEQADATKVLRASSAELKTNKENEIAETQASVDSKKDKLADMQQEEQKKFKTDAPDGLTDKQRKKRDEQAAEEENSKKEWDEEAKKDPNSVYLTVRPVPEKDIEKFWNDFKKPEKGLDGMGFVNQNDIAKAFSKCVERDKFLFWSSGGDFDNPDYKSAFEMDAVKLYMHKTKRVKVANAANTQDCKNWGIAGMQRGKMIDMFHQRVEDEQKEEYLIKNPKDRGKVIKFRWPGAVGFFADGTLKYKYYWPLMSAGFAQGAVGEVHYLRPQRKEGEAGDYLGKHWSDYELPELKKNKDITGVKEVTTPFSKNGKYPITKTEFTEIDRSDV